MKTMLIAVVAGISCGLVVSAGEAGYTVSKDDFGAPTNALTWTSETTRTGPAGAGTMGATGTLTRAAAGAELELERAGTTAGGESWQSTTTGEKTKTDTGARWETTTQGTTEGGHSWTTEGEATKTVNPDGPVTIERDATKTLDSGAVITKSADTTITKTDSGATWVTEGTKTGPRGTATMSGSGSALKTGGGVEVNASHSGTTAGGQDWQATTVGTGSRAGTGAKWNSTTAGSTEAGKTWKTDRQGEYNKSWSGGDAKCKRTANTQVSHGNTAGKCKSGKAAAANKCAGVPKAKPAKVAPAGK